MPDRSGTVIIFDVLICFMSPPEKPKRRLVVYVTENIYEILNSIAKMENRSISSIAEMQILSGLSGAPARRVPYRAGTAHHVPDRQGVDSDGIKSSVIDVLSNLPDLNSHSIRQVTQIFLLKTSLFRVKR